MAETHASKEMNQVVRMTLSMTIDEVAKVVLSEEEVFGL